VRGLGEARHAIAESMFQHGTRIGLLQGAGLDLLLSEGLADHRYAKDPEATSFRRALIRAQPQALLTCAGLKKRTSKTASD